MKFEADLADAEAALKKAESSLAGWLASAQRAENAVANNKINVVASNKKEIEEIAAVIA